MHKHWFYLHIQVSVAMTYSYVCFIITFHLQLPSNITCARNPTLSTSQSGTIETFSLVLCSSINYPSPLAPLTIAIQYTSTTLVIPYSFISICVSTLTFCTIVSYAVNGCVLSPMFGNKRKYNTIQLHYKNTGSCCIWPLTVWWYMMMANNLNAVCMGQLTKCIG